MACFPEYVVNASSVDSFKNRLDKQWSNGDIYIISEETSIFAPQRLRF